MSITRLLPNLYGRELVNLTISRQEIETADTAPALSFLKSLIATPENIVANNGVLSLSLSGYEEMGEYLLAHSVIRHFFVRLDCLFPYWFHVCNRRDRTLKRLFASMVEIRAADSNTQNGNKFECDLDALPIFMHSHELHSNLLHYQNGISKAQSKNIIDTVKNYFEIEFSENTLSSV
jgi:hypothetical protein